MPHVVVKLWPGKTEAQKQSLTDAIVGAVNDILDYGPDAVSVGFDEVPAQDWGARVFAPDILGKWNSLIKEPGYGRRPAGKEK
jgi:4-oxalocrotonate tautomerase